ARAATRCASPARSSRAIRAPSIRRACVNGLDLALGAERDLEQVGDRVRVELFHDVGAVRLDRLDADAEVVGDLLVEPPGDDALEDLRLARRQARQQR